MPQTSPSKGAPISQDVEVDGAGGDRLLQAGVVVGLCEVDPVDLGAGVGLPRLQEAAEQHVVQVLVVEPHEGQFDAGEFAFLDVGLGGAEAQFADLLEIGVGRLALADAGNLQDLRAQIVLRRGAARQRTEAGRRSRGNGGTLAAPFNTSRRIAPSASAGCRVFLHVISSPDVVQALAGQPAASEGAGRASIPIRKGNSRHPLVAALSFLSARRSQLFSQVGPLSTKLARTCPARLGGGLEPSGRLASPQN